MPVNNNRKNTRAGFRYYFVYRRDENGDYVNLDGTAPANGNQYGTQGGYEIRMPQSFNFQIPAPEDIFLDSETETVSWGSVLGSQQRLAFETEIGTFDLDLQAAVVSTNVVSKGATEFGSILPKDPQVPSFMVLEQNLAKSHASDGSFGQVLYNGNFMLNVAMSWLGAAEISLRTPHVNRYRLECDPYEYTSYGLTMTASVEGTCSKVGEPFNAPYWVDICSYRGDGVEDEFFTPRAMPSTAVAGTNVLVFVGPTGLGSMVEQTPGEGNDYTIDPTTNKVDFEAGSVPAAGETIYVFYHWTEEC